MNEEIECFECNGHGFLLFAFPPSGKQPGVTCPACNGKKRLPSICGTWRVKGREMRDERLARRVTLRKEAATRKIDVGLLSKMERGLIEPNPARRED